MIYIFYFSICTSVVDVDSVYSRVEDMIWSMDGEICEEIAEKREYRRSLSVCEDGEGRDDGHPG